MVFGNPPAIRLLAWLHKLQGFKPPKRQLSFTLLYRDSRAIKLREYEPGERFVVGVFLIAQDADGHGFSEQYRLCRVRAPMQTRNVASLRDIVCKLVQFTGKRDLAGIRPRVGREG